MSAELFGWISTLRKLEGFGAAVAPVVARVIEDDLLQTIAAGTSPDGEPWKPTKEGEAPLEHADKAMTVTGVNGRIVVRLKGPEALHSRGYSRGSVKRPIIPHGQRMPDRMAAKVRAVLDAAFDRYMTQGGRV